MVASSDRSSSQEGMTTQADTEAGPGRLQVGPGQQAWPARQHGYCGGASSRFGQPVAESGVLGRRSRARGREVGGGTLRPGFKFNPIPLVQCRRSPDNLRGSARTAIPEGDDAPLGGTTRTA